MSHAFHRRTFLLSTAALSAFTGLLAKPAQGQALSGNQRSSIEWFQMRDWRHLLHKTTEDGHSYYNEKDKNSFCLRLVTGNGAAFTYVHSKNSLDAPTQAVLFGKQSATNPFSYNFGTVTGYDEKYVPVTGDKPIDDRRQRAARRTVGIRIFGLKLSPAISVSLMIPLVHVRFPNSSTAFEAGARFTVIAAGNPVLAVGPAARLLFNDRTADLHGTSVLPSQLLPMAKSELRFNTENTDPKNIMLIDRFSSRQTFNAIPLKGADIGNFYSTAAPHQWAHMAAPHLAL